MSRDCGVAGGLAVADVAVVRADDDLEVGFAHIDITPELRADSPVWLAGYYPGRAATGVHDPLFARCVVLKSGEQKIAWVSVDLIGLQFPAVQELRKRLTDFDYVLVASTHNHEGPDVIGVWGQSFLHRGVNDDYLALVVARMEQAVRRAEKHVRPARASWGTAADESLLRDNRLPIFKDGVLRLLRFADPRGRVDGGIGCPMELPSRGVGCRQLVDYRRLPRRDDRRAANAASVARWCISAERSEDCWRRRPIAFATSAAGC